MLTTLLAQKFFLKSAFCLIFSYSAAYFGIKYFIKYIGKKTQFFQPIRADGPQEHLRTKQKTPTMGGIFIVLATILATILCADLTNQYVLVALFTMTGFALIGLVDDILKVFYNNPKGFRGSIKIVIQFAVVGVAILWLGFIDSGYLSNVVNIPFANNLTINLGFLYLIFVTFVIVGSANAVNFTDGLDGLVSVPAIISLVCFVALILITSDANLSAYTSLIYNSGSKELIIVAVSLIGAIAAFLAFNLKPAKIFMGDVGSLAIGAILGLMAIITKTELLFFIISMLFVIEAVSVILQVASFKIRKRRIFLMAPIHHHFEKLGWSEQKVVRAFWLAALLFALIPFFALGVHYKIEKSRQEAISKYRLQHRHYKHGEHDCHDGVLNSIKISKNKQ